MAKRKPKTEADQTRERIFRMISSLDDRKAEQVQNILHNTILTLHFLKSFTKENSRFPSRGDGEMD